MTNLYLCIIGKNLSFSHFFTIFNMVTAQSSMELFSGLIIRESGGELYGEVWHNQMA